MKALATLVVVMALVWPAIPNAAHARAEAVVCSVSASSCGLSKCCAKRDCCVELPAPTSDDSQPGIPARTSGLTASGLVAGLVNSARFELRSAAGYHCPARATVSSLVDYDATPRFLLGHAILI